MDNTELKPIVRRPVYMDPPSTEAPRNNESADLDGDGHLSKIEEELYEKKAKNRRSMAWVSLIAMVASGFAIMFFIPEARLQKINSMLDLYWISLGGIVGAYVGISTWMSKR